MALAALVEAFYGPDPDSFYSDVRAADGSPLVERIGKLDRAAIERAGRAGQLSYLHGAYRRYGWGHTFQLCNSAQKVTLVTDLLGAQGATGIALSAADGIPRVTTIAFTPGDELAAWLAREDPARVVARASHLVLPEGPADMAWHLERVDAAKRALDAVTDDDARYAEARAPYLDIAVARPADAMAQFDAGYASIHLTPRMPASEAELDAAAGYFRRAIELAPRERAGYWGLQQVHATRHDPDAGIAIALQASERIPDDAQVWMDLGGAYQGAMRGQHAEALAAFQRAMQLAPGDPRTVAMVAQSRRTLGDRGPEVLALYRRVLELHPDESTRDAAQRSIAHLTPE